MSFTDYSSNSTARLQSSLIRSALALAEYRMERDDSSRRPVYRIWHRSARRSQHFCILKYAGWGDGMGKWWHLSETAPQQVRRVVETCLAEDAIVQTTDRKDSTS